MTTTIPELRRSRNITAIDLAEQLGVSPDLLNHWERGRRQWPPEMEQMARTYLLEQPEEPYITPRQRHYLACVQDSTVGIVLLHFRTARKRKVHQMVYQYYRTQGWNVASIGTIRVFSISSSQVKQPHIGTLHA